MLVNVLNAKMFEQETISHSHRDETLFIRLIGRMHKLEKNSNGYC